MRLFQNAALYPTYRKIFDGYASSADSFQRRLEIFFADGWGAPHILKPVMDGSSDAFFTNGDDEILQGLWAREHGMPTASTPEQILLAQIEEHRTEVFYNEDPIRWPSSFVRKLPGCVRVALAWRAAPYGSADFGAYKAMLCNFPSILDSYRTKGWHAEYFTPGLDPEMSEYASNTDRPVDIIFIGGYTRHHLARAQKLERVARLREQCRVVFHLDRSRPTRIAESPMGRLLPLGKYRRPKDIRVVTEEPVFGLDAYKALSRAKIVNAAIDMAGPDRGNIRCWEAMGCGALLVSDTGNYPAGMVNGETMLLYDGLDDISRVLQIALEHVAGSNSIATAGHAMVASRYNKTAQWSRFEEIVAKL